MADSSEVADAWADADGKGGGGGGGSGGWGGCGGVGALELTSGARMLQLKHDLVKVDLGLKDKWKEHEDKMASIDQRKKEMDEKKLKIKENYKTLNVYLQDVNAKRKQALERANQLKALRNQKEQEVDRLKEELNRLRLDKESLRVRVESHSIFESFLKEVASLAGLNEIADVINMADTMTGERDNLLEIISKNQEELKTLREEHSQYRQAKNDEILNLNVELFRLKESKSKVKDKIVEEEKNCIRTSVVTDERIVKIDNVIRTADNLAQTLNIQSNSTTPEQDANRNVGVAHVMTSEKFLKAVELMGDLSDIVKGSPRKSRDCRKGSY